MRKKIGRTLFGLKSGEVEKEFQRVDTEHQEKIISLKVEIERAKVELENSRKKLEELQKELNTSLGKEREIAEVMVTAQINARRIEEIAHEKAQAMLEKSEMELREKEQELHILRIKATQFKEEFREILDKYKLSLETIKGLSDKDISFTPSIVRKKAN